ncbi:MAG TPA: NTP transferase domain-containing protein [Spirochaetales bacterium]|nr:NTP transferase domain-containing protein [Spirochaetales bacterium]HRY55734.1 NTP transferase domain-containing protein [Spirochaetia bacterium]HRZ65380.1 NTP transferase domain-containing protein [Spirochaetia bacterium]
MTGIVVQARLGSTRLPGKALLPLGDSSLVGQAMRRLALVPAELRILATDEASAALLGPAAAAEGYELLVGPAEDVLARYCLAIRRYGLDLVLRATGDNPLVSFELAALLIEERARSKAPADYSAHLGMPLGLGVELVAAPALLRAEAEAAEPRQREHVCPYLYEHPELFSLDRRPAPAEYLLEGARVTVDTGSDYEALRAAYGALYRGRPIPSLELVAWLRTRREREA